MFYKEWNNAHAHRTCVSPGKTGLSQGSLLWRKGFKQRCVTWQEPYSGCCVGRFEGTGLQVGGQLGGLCRNPARGRMLQTDHHHGSAGGVGICGKCLEVMCDIFNLTLSASYLKSGMSPCCPENTPGNGKHLLKCHLLEEDFSRAPD